MLTTAVTIISSVVIARMLAKEDLATYRQTFLAYNFVAPFLTLALPTSLYYFLPRQKGLERRTLLGNLLLLTLMGIVFGAALLFGGSELLARRFNNPELAHTLRFLAPYALFMLPASALDATLLARDQVARLAVYSVVSRCIYVTALVAACLIFSNPEALVLVNVILTGLMLVPSLWLMFRACPGEARLPEMAFLWAMVKYSVPLGLAGILGTLTLQLSNVIVSSMCPPEQFAVYSVGAVELPLVGIITGSITAVLLVDMANHCQRGQMEEALRLFRLGALRSASLLLPVTVFFLLAAHPFIEGLYSAKYVDSTAPFYLYLLMLPARIVVYGAAMMALGKTSMILIRSAVDLFLTFALGVLFVRLFGYLGAAAALVVTLYVWSIPFNFFVISRGFSVRFWEVLPWARLGRVLGISLISAPLALVYHFTPGWPKLAQFLLAATAYWPLALWLLHRSGDLPTWTLLNRFVPAAWVRFGRHA